MKFLRKDIIIMKTNFKKAAAILALTFTFSASVFPAFCIGEEDKLSKHGALVVGKYLGSKQDLVSLMMVKKNFEDLSSTYKYNPTPYDPVLYPNIQTYVSYPEEKAGLNSFTYAIQTLIYTAGSFDSTRYHKILAENKVNDKWKRTLLIDNATSKCKVTFEKEERKIVFYFDPFKSTVLNKTMSEKSFQIDKVIFHYNVFMNVCNIEYVVNPLCFKRNLKRICIPKDSERLEFGCFRDCRFLKSVVIPDSITEIGPCAFAGCLKLEKVDIPDSVTCIQDLSFNNCLSLKSVNIPDSVVEIKEGAFFNCTSLKSIKIPDSVKKLGFGAFRGVPLNHIEYKNRVFNNVNEFLKEFEALNSQNANI